MGSIAETGQQVSGGASYPHRSGPRKDTRGSSVFPAQETHSGPATRMPGKLLPVWQRVDGSARFATPARSTRPLQFPFSPGRKPTSCPTLCPRKLRLLERRHSGPAQHGECGGRGGGSKRAVFIPSFHLSPNPQEAGSMTWMRRLRLRSNSPASPKPGREPGSVPSQPQLAGAHRRPMGSGPGWRFCPLDRREGAGARGPGQGGILKTHGGESSAGRRRGAPNHRDRSSVPSPRRLLRTRTVSTLPEEASRTPYSTSTSGCRSRIREASTFAQGDTAQEWPREMQTQIWALQFEG